jgi:hypothetical protein
VVVIQDDFMKKMTNFFSTHNSWAFDFTFKTNQFGLPLYAAIVPNEDEYDIPIFYILCSIDKQQGHKGIAIELALTHIFESLGIIRPAAIVIDKHRPSLNALINVVNKNIHCWKTTGSTRTQIVRRVLLFHFHVMKAWNKNLVTWVPNEFKDPIWRAVYILIICPDESHFGANLQRFCIEFQHVPKICNIHYNWVGRP